MEMSNPYKDKYFYKITKGFGQEHKITGPNLNIRLLDLTAPENKSEEEVPDYKYAEIRDDKVYAVYTEDEIAVLSVDLSNNPNTVGRVQ
jgi:hypothetical protein